ncbi:hypothetical protein AWB75_06224 [Caballeronia catudaia]|uniref:Uncharacterized protein n=1 Tax=Caballeronia catudaia TaxID=1777136 RepID=A0A158D5K8_9BURK|nr:hypothetical protein AWB75_06224 [Caballeronia catudaia]
MMLAYVSLLVVGTLGTLGTLAARMIVKQRPQPVPVRVRARR